MRDVQADAHAVEEIRAKAIAYLEVRVIGKIAERAAPAEGTHERVAVICRSFLERLAHNQAIKTWRPALRRGVSA